MKIKLNSLMLNSVVFKWDNNCLFPSYKYKILLAEHMINQIFFENKRIVYNVESFYDILEDTHHHWPHKIIQRTI